MMRRRRRRRRRRMETVTMMTKRTKTMMMVMMIMMMMMRRRRMRTATTTTTTTVMMMMMMTTTTMMTHYCISFSPSLIVLKVLCLEAESPTVRCQPLWQPEYNDNIHNSCPPGVSEINGWQDEHVVQALHVLEPKPHPFYVSPQTLAQADPNDFFAKVARHILERSGRSHMLNSPAS
jgi:hypothetical protein